MRLNSLLLGTCVAISFGCTTNSKVPTSPPPAATVAPAKTVADGTVCKYEAEARTLRIESVQPKGCNLWYSNFSKEKPVASSSLATTHCEEVKDRIQKKLESSGYQCSANLVPAKSK